MCVGFFSIIFHLEGFLSCGSTAIALCSSGSIGCRIRLSTDVTKKILHQSFICINEDKTEGLKAGYRTELPRPRTINIDLDIYVEAESSYNVGYGLGGDEFANGVIALDKWDELKNSFREQKKRVEDSNA